MGTNNSTSPKKTSPISISIDKNDKRIPAGNLDLNEIPDDQYLCPNCGKIPEILNVHTENGRIELNCKNHGIINLTILGYYLKMKNNIFSYFKTKCFNCNKEQKSKENMFKYCYYCKVDFCEDCVNNFHQKEKDHRRNHLDVCIPVNEKKNRCLEHYNSNIIGFCMDCQENVCDKESTTKHRGHEKINFITLENDINKYRSIILEKNKILADIIRFNQIILNTYENFQNNYFHIKSLINIGKNLEEENKRDSKELECMIYGLEKNYKVQMEAIKTLQKEFTIDLNGNEVKLSLRKRNFGNKIEKLLQLVSKIKFKNLKEIDISQNNIKNIVFLNEMNLPHLEYLNCSYNNIENIEPIAELNSKNLKEICLQNNNIKDINPFLKSDFPALERLRIENNNNFDKSLPSFQDLINKKFKNKVFYNPTTAKDLKEKFGEDINLSDEIIKLNHLNNKNDKNILIQELYLMVEPDNNIKHLKLDDNNISNAFLLSRIPLDNLRSLDLSVNNITNLKFLTEMRMPNLTTIYLDENKINDIYPLIQIKENWFNCPNLKIISLKGNNLRLEDKESKEVIKALKDKDITLDVELPKK